MGIKLIAFDLDGTTLDNQGNISDENIAAITRAVEKGYILVPCTGRCYREIPDAVLRIPGIVYVITSNGARIYQHDRNIASYCMNPGVVKRIMDLLCSMDALPELYCDGTPYVPAEKISLIHKVGLFAEYDTYYTTTRTTVADMHQFMAENLDNVEKINCFMFDPDGYRRIKETLTDIWADLEVTASFSSNLEFTTSGITKGFGLETLCKLIGVERETVLAMGDSYNDVSMLEYAHEKYAPANAVKEVADIAHRTKRKASESALAEVLMALR